MLRRFGFLVVASLCCLPLSRLWRRSLSRRPLHRLRWLPRQRLFPCLLRRRLPRSRQRPLSHSGYPDIPPSPLIDGVIDSGEWDTYYSNTAGDWQVTTYSNWDGRNLYVALKSNKRSTS